MSRWRTKLLNIVWLWLVVAVCAPGDAIGGAYEPEFPLGLAARVRASDSVILGVFEPQMATVHETTIRIEETWKGGLRGRIEVGMGRDLSAPEAYASKSRGAILAFITQARSSVPMVSSVIEVRREDVAVLRASIQEVARWPDVYDTHALRTWLVRALAHRATRGQAFFDLFPAWPFSRKSELHEAFSHDELRSIASGFAREASADDTVLKLLYVLEGFPSKAVDHVAAMALDRVVESECVRRWAVDAFRILLRRRRAAHDLVGAVSDIETPAQFIRAWRLFRPSVTNVSDVAPSWGPSYAVTVSTVLLPRVAQSSASALKLMRRCKD